MIDCKKVEKTEDNNLGLQMFELKMMQFKIDCIFWKKIRWWPSYKWCPYNVSTSTAVLDGMLDALFFIQSH